MIPELQLACPIQLYQVVLSTNFLAHCSESEQIDGDICARAGVREQQINLQYIKEKKQINLRFQQRGRGLLGFGILDRPGVVLLHEHEIQKVRQRWRNHEQLQVLQKEGFLRYLYEPVEKRLVCNRKGSICKDPTVEINYIRLVFLAVVR
jgi:hypothetical protein